MQDKLQIARENILRDIESGSLKAGDKLPAAREFAEKVGVSLGVAQMAFNSLVRDGILTSIPRQGTYVRHDWRKRILPGSVLFFRDIWKILLGKEFFSATSGLRLCDKFEEGIFEIRWAMDVLKRQEDYLDLSEFFEEAYPDRSDFFAGQFQAFRTPEGRLYGIPLLFSPWVICFHPEMIRKAGGKLPYDGWTWEEFLDLIRVLRKTYPAESVFNFFPNASLWMNFVFHAGGSIIDRQNGKPVVRLEEPATLESLRKVGELYQLLDFGASAPCGHGEYAKRFAAGELAVFAAPRQDVDFNSAIPWRNVPFPVFPGQNGPGRQAGELLCIRRQVCDFSLVREVIRQVLSPAVQDRIGSMRYGIPIRRTSAIRSLRDDDPRDRVFFSEMPRIVPDHNFACPELFLLTEKALNRIWLEQAAVEDVVPELALTLRTLLRYRSPEYSKQEQ